MTLDFFHAWVNVDLSAGFDPLRRLEVPIEFTIGFDIDLCRDFWRVMSRGRLLPLVRIAAAYLPYFGFAIAASPRSFDETWTFGLSVD